MDPIATFIFLSILCFGQGMVFEGEEGKRQGLIPFPRVGRTLNPWIPVLYHPDLDDVDDKRQVVVPYPRIGRTTPFNTWLATAYQPSELEDKQEFAIPDDLLAVRYTRGVLTPRFGRRKRSQDDTAEGSPRDITLENATSLTSKTKELGDMLRKTPWAIVAYKDGVDKKMIFSPRLGRAMPSSASMARGNLQNDDNDEDNTDKRASSPFTPRLGRAYRIDEPLSLNQVTPFEVSSRAVFTPRMGRSGKTGYQQRLWSLRMGRAHGSTLPTRSPPSRVGREDRYVPRLGPPRMGRSDPLLSSTTSDNSEQSSA